MGPIANCEMKVERIPKRMVKIWSELAVVNAHNREDSIELPYTLSKMSLLSNSVYSSVFKYNPYVLT